eukprot:GFYU01017462.1.p1 GENE.GFYU01017462.1~~GFYU01017462.1.p1  ORF type:complete len:129 (-),score=3.78 GFYU01017462.1:226-612(-)
MASNLKEETRTVVAALQKQVEEIQWQSEQEMQRQWRHKAIEVMDLAPRVLKCRTLSCTTVGEQSEKVQTSFLQWGRTTRTTNGPSHSWSRLHGEVGRHQGWEQHGKIFQSGTAGEYPLYNLRCVMVAV